MGTRPTPSTHLVAKYSEGETLDPEGSLTYTFPSLLPPPILYGLPPPTPPVQGLLQSTLGPSYRNTDAHGLSRTDPIPGVSRN